MDRFDPSSLNFNDFKLTTIDISFLVNLLDFSEVDTKLGREWLERERKGRRSVLREAELDGQGWSSLRQNICLESRVRTRGEKDCRKFRRLLRRNKPSVSVKNIYGTRHLVDRRYADIFPRTLPK